MSKDEWMISEEVLKELEEKLWIQFSNIQCASYIVQDEESIKRFNKWLSTGDDEEAWT